MTAIAESQPKPIPLRTEPLKALVLALLVIFAAGISLSRLAPPGPVSEQAPETAFSSGRAMRHLRLIAQAPRPVGSRDAMAARDYIYNQLRELGVAPEVQKTTVVNTGFGSPALAATVENVVAKLPGTAAGKSILCVAHYDSVPMGPGASDDASSVAALLETLRALKASAPLKNDVVFLFTDGEEAGLLGAKAFIDEQADARQVGLVLNFEARGNSGPSIMFETSRGGTWLLGEFAKAAPRPAANSLSNEIYKRIPNDTDFTLFKRANYAGLNFAFIDGIDAYHTRLDTVDGMSESTLQHQGSLALALVRHFGDLDLATPEAGDAAVYFDVLAARVVLYPAAWSLGFWGLTVLLYAGIVTVGLRRKRLSLAGLLKGILGFVVCLGILVATMAGLFWAVERAHASANDFLFGKAYSAGTYFAGFVALSIGLVALIYGRYVRRARLAELFAGVLLVWLLLAAGVTVSVPGGSYLFLWPAFFGLVSLAALVDEDETCSWKKVVALGLGILPALILMVPMIYLIFQAMTLRAVIVITLLLGLLLGLLIPHLHLINRQRRWLLPGVSAVVALALFVTAALGAGRDSERPLPTNLFYALSADSGKAVWGSYDAAPNAWTAQYLGANFTRGALTEYIPTDFNGFISSEAPAVGLSAPAVQPLDDTTSEGVRSVSLKIKSTREAEILSFYLESPAEVLEASINGKPFRLPPAPRWGFRYFAIPSEGIVLALKLKTAEPLKVRVMDLSYALPQISGKAYAPRAANMMASMSPYSDSTLVSKTFIL